MKGHEDDPPSPPPWLNDANLLWAFPMVPGISCGRHGLRNEIVEGISKHQCSAAGTKTTLPCEATGPTTVPRPLLGLLRWWI